MRFTFNNEDYKIYFRYDWTCIMTGRVAKRVIDATAVVIRYLTPKKEGVLSPSEIVAQHTVEISSKDFVRKSLRPWVLAQATDGMPREFRQAVNNAYTNRRTIRKKASA